MANLDEKLLDGPNVGYCSSSDDEEPSGFIQAKDDGVIPSTRPGQGAQTGPKGVMKDYRMHQKEQYMKKDEHKNWCKEQSMRMATTGQPVPDDEDDDDELEKLRRQRLNQIKASTKGKVMEIQSKDDFLQILDNSGTDTLILIHIYRDNSDECDIFNEVLLTMSARTLNVQYYKVKASVLETTDKFASTALPTLQAYVGGELVGNHIRIHTEFSDEYDADDLCKFLSKNGIRIKLSDG